MANNENEVKVTFKAFNKDFNKSVSDMNKEASKLRQEMKLEEEQLKLTGTETQKLESKLSGLGKSYDIAKNKTAATAEQLAKAKALWGENSAEAQNLETQLKRAQIAEQQVANSIQETTNSLGTAKQAEQDQANALQKLEQLFADTDKSADDFASVLGSDVVNAIKNGTASVSQLEKAFNDISKASLSAAGELSEIDKALKFDEGNVILLGQKFEVLQDVIQQTTTKFDSLKQQQQEVERKFASGEISAEGYRTFQRELAETEAKLKSFKSQADDVKVKIDAQADTSDLDKAESKLKGLGDAAKTAGKEIGTSLSAGAAAGTSAIGAIAVGMEETNINLAMLETQAKNAGLAMSDIKVARGNFAAVGQDVGQITEAMGNLVKAGYKTEVDLTKVSKGIAGAIVTYGETFNAEGLAESITTTTQLGEVTGQLTDLLEKEGVNVKDFNAKLQSMNSVTERANFVSQTLADEGLNASYEGYAKEHEEIVKNAKAKQELQDATSALSIAIIPLITTITNVVTSLAAWSAAHPGLAQAIAVVMAVITAISGAIMVLTPIISAITTLWPILATAIGAVTLPLTTVIAIIAGVVIAVIAIIVAIKNWGAITDWLSIKWTVFKEFLSSIWASITQVALVAWNALISFFKKWGTTILAVLTGPIGLLVLLISKNWDKIKQVTKTLATSVVNKITELKTNTVNKFKELVTQAVTKITELKTNVVKKITELKTSAQTKMSELKTAIVNKFVEIKTSSLNKVSEMKNVVVNKFIELKKSISSKMIDIKLAIQSGWNRAQAFLQKISLVNIGKNIIQGLVNGIGSAKAKISAAVKRLADGIPETIKKILGIHSPSRVMRDEVGFWIGEGLAQGITANTKAEKAAKGKAQAIVKSFNSDLKSLKLDVSAGKINTSQYVTSLKKLKKEYGDYSIGVKTINAEINKTTTKQASDTVKKQKATLKERFSDDKTYYTNKSKLDSTSMQQELTILNSLSKEYKKNSDERIYFENLAKQKKQEIAKQKTKIDETYYKNVKKLNEDYLASEKKLNDEYKKAVDDRAATLNSSAGLFDAVNVDSSVSGEELLYNLRDQVSAFDTWRRDIDKLTKRGLNKGLITELQAMGPSAAAEISALTELSDSDLSDYAQLWKQKSNLARTEAIKELEPMRVQTEKKIQELKTSTATKLKEYQNVWTSSMKSVTGSAKSAANAMPNIGKLAVSNLISGMNSKKKELSTVAKEINKIVASVNKTASSIKNKTKANTTKTTSKSAPLNERVLGANNRVAAIKTRSEATQDNGAQNVSNLILDIPIQIDGATFAKKTVKYMGRELASEQTKTNRGRQN